MEPDGFWDRNHRFSYLVARENARRIVADPEALALGAAHLARFASQDPRQARGYALWRELLTLSRHEIAMRLTDRTEHGDYVRQTAPSFGGLSAAVRARLVRESREPVDADHDG